MNVDDGVLTLSGNGGTSMSTNATACINASAAMAHSSEAFHLPEGVEPNSVQASFENGVLEVTMPLPTEKARRGRDVPIGAKSTANVSH